MEILKGGGKAIISLGKERGWLLAQKEIRHKYPYDWKSKQPVILRYVPAFGPVHVLMSCCSTTRIVLNALIRF